MSHGNPDITTELAARILRRVARIRRTVRRSPDLNLSVDVVLMYLDDIENLVHFNDPYGEPEGQMTPGTFDPPIVQPAKPRRDSDPSTEATT